MVKKRNIQRRPPFSSYAYTGGSFERRLDIILYRMNFIPTISWSIRFLKCHVAVYVNGNRITKPDYRVPDNSIIQIKQTVAQKFKFFFPSHLFNKIISPNMDVDPLTYSGIFYRPPTIHEIRDIDQISPRFTR